MKSHSYCNLAKSYHSKGDFEKAGYYYMASVKESPRPQDFVLPYYGLGQVQIKLGDFRSSLANFEKVLEAYPDSVESMKAIGNIYVQLGQTDKSLEIIRKAKKIDPQDAHVVWALGNIVGDSPCYRNFVLSQGALGPLLCQFSNHSKQSMLRNDTWTLSNFCRDYPAIPF